MAILDVLSRAMAGNLAAENARSLDEIRELVAALHGQLKDLKVLRPQAWRWYRILGGRRVLVGCPDRDGDFPAFAPETGQMWVLRPDGTPITDDFGQALVKVPLNRWGLLVEDLGPAFSESHLLELADEICEAVEATGEDVISAALIRTMSKKYLEARRCRE